MTDTASWGLFWRRLLLLLALCSAGFVTDGSDGQSPRAADAAWAAVTASH